MAQRLLDPLIEGRNSECFVFSPAESVKQRMEVKRVKRISKVQPSQIDRSVKNPAVVAGDRYCSDSYRRAVEYACIAAGVAKWKPNQLRHACGTRVRRKFGVEAARSVLGHSNKAAGNVTDRYTREAIEREFIAAAGRVMALIG